MKFKVGDQVLLSTANIRNQGRAPKLAPRFIGPFSVCRVVSDVAYELKLPPTMKIHPVFHISKLRQYVDGVNQFPTRPTPVTIFRLFVSVCSFSVGRYHPIYPKEQQNLHLKELDDHHRRVRLHNHNRYPRQLRRQ